MKEMFHNIKNGELPVLVVRCLSVSMKKLLVDMLILKPLLFLCRLGVMDISILSKILANSTWSFSLSISKIGAIFLI